VSDLHAYFLASNELPWTLPCFTPWLEASVVGNGACNSQFRAQWMVHCNTRQPTGNVTHSPRGAFSNKQKGATSLLSSLTNQLGKQATCLNVPQQQTPSDNATHISTFQQWKGVLTCTADHPFFATNTLLQSMPISEVLLSVVTTTPYCCCEPEEQRRVCMCIMGTTALLIEVWPGHCVA
jgi:hypothetical protein